MKDNNSGHQPVKTKEEILKSLHIYRGFSFDYDGMLKAMEEYASVREGQQERTKVNLGERFVTYSSLKDKSIPQEWHQIWHEIEVWYGDVRKEESAENLIKRLRQILIKATEGQQSAGVWRKVSEKLPDHSGVYHLRFGEEKLLYWNNDFKQWHTHQYSTGAATVHPNTIWLDESPVPSKEQGEERRMELEKENARLKAENEGHKEIAIARGEAITELQNEIERLKGKVTPPPPPTIQTGEPQIKAG